MNREANKPLATSNCRRPHGELSEPQLFRCPCGPSRRPITTVHIQRARGDG
jgi:hypothetical protein